MAIQIEQGFSVSVPVEITDGPAPAAPDTTTALTDVISGDPTKVAVTYPDPTPGVANPARSIRVDMLAGTAVGAGANFHARYTSPYDGTIRNLADLATATRAPNAGAAAFGVPSASFRTPTP